MAAKRRRTERGGKKTTWNVSAPGQALSAGDDVPPGAIVWREAPNGGMWAGRVGDPVFVYAARAPRPPPPPPRDVVAYEPTNATSDARSWGDWKHIHYLSRLDHFSDSLAELGGAVLLDGVDVRPQNPAEVLLRDATRWERPDARLTFALPRSMAGYAARDRAATKARALCSTIYSFWRALRARTGTESIYWTTRYYEAFLAAFPGQDPFVAQSAGGQARSSEFAETRNELEEMVREFGYDSGDLPRDAAATLSNAAGAKGMIRGASESSCRRAIERVRAGSK